MVFSLNWRELIVDIVAKVLKVERVRYVYVKEEKKESPSAKLYSIDDWKN